MGHPPERSDAEDTILFVADGAGGWHVVDLAAIEGMTFSPASPVAATTEDAPAAGRPSILLLLTEAGHSLTVRGLDPESAGTARTVWEAARRSRSPAGTG